MDRWRRIFLVCTAAWAGGACATAEAPAAAARDPEWAANGWLTPERASESEIIGLFVTRAECEAALDAWLAAQLVGNPAYGDCLPIDRR